MAETELLAMVHGQATAVRLVPTTFSDTTILTLLTNMDFPSVGKVAAEFAAPSTSTDKKYFESPATMGRSYSIENTANKLNAQTGEAMADDAAASSDKIAMELHVTKAQRDTLITYKIAGTPIFIFADDVRLNSSGAVVGFQLLLGKITEFSVTPADEMYVVAMTITGGTVFTETATTGDMAAFNSAAAGALAVTDAGDLTLPSVDAGEWTDILLGKIVLPDAA